MTRPLDPVTPAEMFGLTPAACPQCGVDHAARRATFRPALPPATSAWVVRASESALPVHRDPAVARETVNDIIRRTMPRVGGEVR